MLEPIAFAQPASLASAPRHAAVCSIENGSNQEAKSDVGDQIDRAACSDDAKEANRLRSRPPSLQCVLYCKYGRPMEATLNSDFCQMHLDEDWCRPRPR